MPQTRSRPPLPLLIALIALPGTYLGTAAHLGWPHPELAAPLAVLPEYAVDFVFSHQAGTVFAENGRCVPGPDGADPCTLALANMTGANRVLVASGGRWWCWWRPWPCCGRDAAAATRPGRRAPGGSRCRGRCRPRSSTSASPRCTRCTCRCAAR